MSWEIFTTIESGFTAIGIPMYMVAIGFLIAIIIGLLIIGIDFKYSIAFVSPAVIGFANIGWFPIWVSTLFWILIAGFGLYLLYSIFAGM